MNDRTLPLRVESLVGTVLDGRYELLERIGKGGMGEVYRARHVSIKRDVAVKVLRPGVRERFRREVATIASKSAAEAAPIVP